MSELTRYEQGRGLVLQTLFIGGFALIGLILGDAISWVNPLASAVATGSVGVFVWAKEQELTERKLNKSGDQR